MSVLVAIPVVVFASLLIGTMVHATYNEVYRFRVRNEASSLLQDLRETLDSRASCSSSLSGTNHYNGYDATSPEGMDLSYNLNDGDDDHPASVIGSNVELVKYGIRVNSLKFKAFSSGGTDFAEDPRIPGNKLQYGELIISTEDLNGTKSKVAPRDQSLGGVVLSVEAGGNISRCFLLDQGFDLCTQSGGTLDADDNCIMPSFCAAGNLYTGMDASGNPICVLPATLLANSCPAGMMLVSNGAGSASCQIPPAPTPTPTPTPSPSPSPTVSPTVSPSPTASPTVSPTPTPSPSPTVTPSPTPKPSPTGPPDPQIIYTQQQLAFASSSMPIACKNFLSNTTPLDLTATNDVTISGSKLHYTLDSARNFSADGIGAIDVTVNSAVNVPLLKGATDFFVRTQYLDTMFSGGDKFLMVLKNIRIIYTSAGPLCVTAETIETMDGIAGKHHIIAKSIGIIDGGTGTLNIYGATVNTVKDYTGTVCLFNGAKILNLISSPLAKVRTDCP